MPSAARPRGRDWLAGLAAGAVLGLVLLGIGGRIGMRLVAMHGGQPGIFTIDGSVVVSLLGAVAGAVVAVIFLLARAVSPRHSWLRGVAFWTICLAIVLRGIRPLSVFNVVIFLPLFVAHGALLHVFWWRVRPSAHSSLG